LQVSAIAGSSAPRGAAARLPHTVPRFLISPSAIKGKASEIRGCRLRSRKKTSKSCCRQHAPTDKSSCKSMKSKLRTPLMSTRCSGLSRPLWIIGIRVCPPAKIRARDPHSERVSSTSSIDVGEKYVNIPGIIQLSIEIEVQGEAISKLLAADFAALPSLYNTPQRATPFQRNPTRNVKGSPLFTIGKYPTT
jgi:hypothetical protein